MCLRSIDKNFLQNIQLSSFFTLVDLWGIGPQPPPCHGGVMPFYYRPGFTSRKYNRFLLTFQFLVIEPALVSFHHFFKTFLYGPVQIDIVGVGKAD